MAVRSAEHKVMSLGDGSFHLLRPIDPDEVRIGMTVYSVERYASGSVLTFFGAISTIGREPDGRPFADLRGIPHQGINGRKPISFELYEVMAVES